MDLEINQYITNLPKWVVTFDSFPTIQFPKFAGTKTYYELLQQNLNSQNPDSNLQNFMNNSKGKTLSWEEFKDAIDKGNIIIDHMSWDEFDKLSDAEKELIKSQSDYILKNCAEQIQKQRGTIPGELKEVINELFKIILPIFNWKSYFRRYLGYSSDVIVRKTIRKESKRFKDASGLKIKFKQKILIAIDTSGSISDTDLIEFFQEIYHIYKTGSVSITILEFDSKIQRKYLYKGRWNGTIHGRGGTCFIDPINYFNENRNTFTSLVMFTDGYAPIDNIKPYQKMMWVITHNGDQDKKYPGYSIFIPKRK